VNKMVENKVEPNYPFKDFNIDIIGHLFGPITDGDPFNDSKRNDTTEYQT